MKRMLLVTVLAFATVGTSSGCRLFGWGQGDRCNPCGYSQSNCGSAILNDGGVILPPRTPNPTNHVLPGPVEPAT
ncbi:MAG: hypothetical protein U1A77_16870 [Pirellulales bacterium]|jgi:hypothetical protein